MDKAIQKKSKRNFKIGKKKIKPENVFEELPPQRDYFTKIKEQNEELLQNIKKNLPKLERLLKEINGHWVYEDGLYRLFHQSFKVYNLQSYTVKIVGTLKKLAPEGITKINPDFEEIYKEGTGIKFEMKHNMNWLKHTRPIVEAFLYARAFLDMTVKYGKELEHAPDCLPSGWALALYFWGLR
jgi:hypothetical protein